MFIIESSQEKVLQDLQEYAITDKHDTFGYLTFKYPAIYSIEPVKDKEKQETNTTFVESAEIQQIPLPLFGGTIVNNAGDLGFLLVSRDRWSKWEYGAMKFLKRYLAKHYGISTEIKGNDMLIDGKKFVGTAHGFTQYHRLSAMFVSMNSDTEWLIKHVCTKENKHKGFIGLDTFGVCPKKLINAMKNYAIRWEGYEL